MDDRELLRKNYEDACNAYLRAFCQKHGYDEDDAVNSWAAGDVGGIAPPSPRLSIRFPARVLGTAIRGCLFPNLNWSNSKEIMREIKFRGKCYKGPYENYRIGKIA